MHVLYMRSTWTIIFTSLLYVLFFGPIIPIKWTTGRSLSHRLNFSCLSVTSKMIPFNFRICIRNVFMGHHSLDFLLSSSVDMCGSFLPRTCHWNVELWEWHSDSPVSAHSLRCLSTQRVNNLIFFIMIILFHIFLQLFAKREDNRVHKEIHDIEGKKLYSGYKDNNTSINT